MSADLRAARERYEIESDYTAGRIDAVEYAVLVAGVDDDLRRARLWPWEVAAMVAALVVLLFVVRALIVM